MARPTKKTLISVLSRTFDAPNRSLQFYSQSIFFVEEENDFVETMPEYGHLTDVDVHTIKLALDLGYLKTQTEYWEHHPDEAPPGRNVLVSLTGKGFEYLNDNDAPFWERIVPEISRNLITIIVSVLSAVLISLALKSLGIWQAKAERSYNLPPGSPGSARAGASPVFARNDPWDHLQAG